MSLLPPPPTLNCQFDKAETPEDMASLLKSLGITFDRGAEASPVATYINKLGQIKSVPANLPRLGFDPVTGEARGLPIEDSRTNLILYSEDFTDANWTKSGASVASNTTVSPSGATDADTITDNNGATNERIEGDVSITSSTNDYSFSVFIKKKSSNFFSVLQLQFQGVTTINYAVQVNLLNGDVTDVGTAFSGSGASATSIAAEDFGDYWRLYIVGADNGSGNTECIFRIFPAVGTSLGDLSNTTGVIDAWGAQLEEGPFPTLYIPTSGSTATRSAEDCYIDGTAFTDFYNQDEGTILVESIIPTQLGGDKWIFNIETNGNDRLWAWHRGSYDRLYFQGWANGGVQQFTGYLSHSTEGGILKSGYRLAENDIKMFANGSEVFSDTSAVMPSVGKIYIGKSDGGGRLNSYIKRILYWPVALTDEQLTNLTRVV